MAIDLNIRKEDRLLIAKGVSAVTAEDFFNFISEFPDHEDYEKGFGILVDLRDASEIKLSTSDIERIVRLSENIREKRGNGDCAIVVYNDLSYGLARMFQSMSCNADYTIQVFKDLKDAEDFLLNKEEE